MVVISGRGREIFLVDFLELRVGLCGLPLRLSLKNIPAQPNRAIILTHSYRLVICETVHPSDEPIDMIYAYGFDSPDNAH